MNQLSRTSTRSRSGFLHTVTTFTILLVLLSGRLRDCEIFLAALLL